ncbi:MerR family transcriptional regulator [Actinoallomurus bryophytorum]|uniref:DNA-binding transcriptional MerR regulator n=1 Tax=Actinoallomurus bryophytorum TaxID=1490222 RepID=A0A543CF14_9ACTN|nr:MerR family transcriptional regulator [Actinoallomurus bryophytorum]TQL95686.1 DNA-binding transcriptional MerR regulator [Actinoallomurus bryophytorum]
MTQAVNEALTIAEAAERSGVSTHTLRYYERIGALREPPERAPSGHRRYTERDLSWIELLTRLRATGMPIATMLRYTELAREGTSTAAERKALLLAHRAEVAARVDQLRHDLEMIDYKINAYDKIERERIGCPDLR